MSGRSRAARLAAWAAALTAAATLAALELAAPGAWPEDLRATRIGMPALAGGGLVAVLAAVGWAVRGLGPPPPPEEGPPC